MDNEFWKQMFGSLARHLIVTLGGALLAGLVAKGVLSEEQAKVLLDETTVAAIVGFLLVAGGIVWSYMKIKFNLNFVKAAIKADPETPVAEIKEAALQRETTQTSV
jgi:hypothetical protein